MIELIQLRLTSLHESLNAAYEDRFTPDGEQLHCPDWCSGVGDCIVCILEAEIEDLKEQIRAAKSELEAAIKSVKA